MHPAKSVILFTVLSGLGYGTINLLLLSLLGGHPPSMTHTLGFIIGMSFATIGLLSSTFHLGRPERAWRALSQWRTSWLSREGVFAFLSFICPVVIIAGPYFVELTSQMIISLAIISFIINLATVHCTAMIYASLKPIPAWHNKLTPIVYHMLSLTTGSFMVLVLLSFSNKFAPFLFYVTLFLLVFSALLKRLYWHRVDNATAVATASSATGLKGKISVFEKPHSSANYLMKEMVFQVGRKHAAKLRRLSIILGFVVPACGLIFMLYSSEFMLLTPILFIISMSGIFMERWLFFAEAKHVVSLYYGNESV